MNKEQTIELLIRGVWDSLESHLEYTHKPHQDGKDFHKRCVRDYATMILLLTELYEKENKRKK